MKARAVLPLLLSAALVALCGCTAKTVRCDGKLTPINAPAARAETTEAAPETGR